MKSLTHVELCAGAGGLALGCGLAGFQAQALYEEDRFACATLRTNVMAGRLPGEVLQQDIATVSWKDKAGQVDLVAAGLPCQPFSLAGSHRAVSDKRNLFPELVRAVRELEPSCVIVENVPGMIRPRFRAYFAYLLAQLAMPSRRRRKGER